MRQRDASPRLITFARIQERACSVRVTPRRAVRSQFEMRTYRPLATLAAFAILIATTGTTTLYSQKGVSCGDKSTTLVVSPSSLQDWQQQHAHCNGGSSTGSQAFVTGPATPPLG